jgi:uroporphyrinogen decarboxylase
MDLMGVENYMIKTYTDPDIINAITDHVCSFYIQANEIFYKAAGSKIDAFFFGNDFGTQRDLLISPSHFDRFVLPYIKRLIEQARSHDYQIILHSCGSVHGVIEIYFGRSPVSPSNSGEGSKNGC